MPGTDDQKRDKDASEFPLLKDDSVAGVEARDVPEKPQPQEAPAKPSLFAELPEQQFSAPARSLTLQSRRDFLIFGAGTVAAAAGFWWLLPDDLHQRVLPDKTVHRLDTLEARAGLTSARKERFFGRALTFDDDVAAALYSRDRSVPTYSKRDAKSDFLVQTDVVPQDDSFVADWTLTLSGLKGRDYVLNLKDLLTGFAHQEQVTRLCCVEGWSAIAWWGGLPFADLLAVYQPAPGMKWASLVSEVSADSDGNNYYVSIDLETARHPQTLLATHYNGQPISFGHGAPLRLVAPMKLGLKNIKHITKIVYTAEQPPDYWAERGYSKYDGL
jgi:DMSO/TMAO reductase YedYZ molybdopterin-dependent catalytic subunit